MDREEIIRMARNEYGIYAFTAESLAEFATIIAAAEREACAKVCDVLAVHPEYASDITKVAAQAIRARGNSETH